MLQVAEVASLEYWAERKADEIAVVKGDASLTYAEWNDQANRIADALAGHGLGPGDRLGMRFRLGFPWFIVQRALQKLGVEQVSVNWRLTADEAVYVLRDSGAKGLACDDGDPSPWVEQDVGVLISADHGRSGPWLRFEDLLSEGKPAERFGLPGMQMVFYTSGTTGRPKGVRHDLSASADMDRLRRYVESVAAVPPLPPDPVVLLTLPVHHGAGAGVANRACAAGGKVVLLDPYDPEDALRLIERHRVQAWTAVPTMLHRVRALGHDVLRRYDLSSLLSLSTGAAPVPHALKEWIVGYFGPEVLWEQYGITEAGMITYLAPQDHVHKLGSSGRPYDGVEIAILDVDGNRLPTGATGEIAVNTPTILSGYLGHEQLGEDVVKDGFYRTGDVGHLDEDGYLFITDRSKDMIVAGGVNIYPAEIEKEVVAHPDVEDCAVIGIPHEDFGEQVLAFVVRRSGTDVKTGELREFLEGRLAAYKMPRRVEFVDELPVSAAGKVLKTELRAPYWQGRERNV